MSSETPAMSRTPEQIAAELTTRWGDDDGAWSQHEMTIEFAAALRAYGQEREAEGRRIGLEEAAKKCDAKAKEHERLFDYDMRNGNHDGASEQRKLQQSYTWTAFDIRSALATPTQPRGGVDAKPEQPDPAKSPAVPGLPTQPPKAFLRWLETAYPRVYAAIHDEGDETIHVERLGDFYRITFINLHISFGARQGNFNDTDSGACLVLDPSKDKTGIEALLAQEVPDLANGEA